VIALPGALVVAQLRRQSGMPAPEAHRVELIASASRPVQPEAGEAVATACHPLAHCAQQVVEIVDPLQQDFHAFAPLASLPA